MRPGLFSLQYSTVHWCWYLVSGVWCVGLCVYKPHCLTSSVSVSLSTNCTGAGRWRSSLSLSLSLISRGNYKNTNLNELTQTSRTKLIFNHLKYLLFLSFHFNIQHQLILCVLEYICSARTYIPTYLCMTNLFDDVYNIWLSCHFMKWMTTRPCKNNIYYILWSRVSTEITWRH